MRGKWFIITPLIFGIIPLAGISFLEWATVAEHGSDVFSWLKLLLFLPGLAAIPCMAIGIIGASSPRFRTKGVMLALCSLTFITGLYHSSGFGRKIRMSAFHRLAERSRPFVAAIHSYERKYGVPPPSLDALVPEFLSTIPKTGMAAYPEYRFHRPASNYDGNPWAITVFTPSGGINFDQFMYFPLTNYPEVGYGGRLERIGDWAYVHE
jgi:hypothetical protein